MRAAERAGAEARIVRLGPADDGTRNRRAPAGRAHAIGNRLESVGIELCGEARGVHLQARRHEDALGEIGLCGPDTEGLAHHGRDGFGGRRPQGLHGGRGLGRHDDRAQCRDERANGLGGRGVDQGLEGEGRHAVRQRLRHRIGRGHRQRGKLRHDLVLSARYARKKRQVGLEFVPCGEFGEPLRADEKEGAGVGENGEGRLRLLPDVHEAALGGADIRHNHLRLRMKFCRRSRNYSAGDTCLPTSFRNHLR